MIIYAKLEKILDERKISKRKLHEDTGITTNAIAKFAKNESVSTDTIDKICTYLHVQPGDIMEYIDDEIMKQMEIQKLEKKLKELKTNN